jgi:hypothetical protein
MKPWSHELFTLYIFPNKRGKKRVIEKKKKPGTTDLQIDPSLKQVLIPWELVKKMLGNCSKSAIHIQHLN